MRVAYFVNVYPAVSHTFIRREIHALQKLGVSIARFAIRAQTHLVDPLDRAEAEQTKVILQAGAETFLLALLRALTRRPAQFFAVCVQAIRMGRRSDRGLWRHFAYVLEATVLADWCSEARADHIHAHFGSNSTAIAMFASRLSGISYSFTSHGPFEYDTAPQQSFDEKMRYAAFAVCVSFYGRAQLMRYAEPEQWAKIAIVHCGLDETFLHDDATDCPAARRFVCVGRLCAEKAQQVLVGAAKRLRDAGETFEIVLVGDGPTRGQIEAAIRNAGLQDFVTLIGWASGDRVKSEILAARALVLPSFAENLPVVIMEAMALGRPVISTYIAGIPELVGSGETGWLTPASDEEALAAAMLRALSACPEQLTTMGAAGRRRVLARHDALVEAAKLKALFERHAGGVTGN